MTRIAVLGLGYVGLPTAACFASRGIETIGIETDRQKLERLKRGGHPAFEPKLAGIFKKAFESRLLRLTSSINDAKDADFIFLCVGTPSLRDGSIDLSFVERATGDIAELLRAGRMYTVVVLKSTAIPGTTMGIVRSILEQRSDRRLGEFGLCCNPEFLREGKAVDDTLFPDRVVIGEADRESGERLTKLFKKFYGKETPPIIRTTPANAEMIKYASNAFLAMKVSFINQIATLCEATPGSDVVEVARGIGLDPRIGGLFLRAGLGYGGSCFPKDLPALREFAKAKGIETPLLDGTIKINEEQARSAVNHAEEVLGNLTGKRIALLGLAFKPETDDMRGAVSIKLVPEFLARGASVAAYDPVAMENAEKILDGVEYARSAIECLDGADCAVLVTEWREFGRLKPSTFKKRMRTPFVIDGRRLYEPEAFLRQGVLFMAVGLSTQHLMGETVSTLQKAAFAGH